MILTLVFIYYSMSLISTLNFYLGPLKLHGFVREMVWSVVSEVFNRESNEQRLTLQLSDDAYSRKMWQHQFSIQLVITLSLKSLHMSINVTNNGTSEFQFGTCFHPYFKTSDIHKVCVEGLQQCEFVDKVDGRKRKIQCESKLIIESAAESSGGYVDRIYDCNPKDICNETDRDSDMNNIQEQSPTKLTIIDDSTGSEYQLLFSRSYLNTVVFNPWINGKRGHQHPDFDDDGYNYMICVEPTIAEAQSLAAHDTWNGWFSVTVR